MSSRAVYSTGVLLLAWTPTRSLWKKRLTPTTSCRWSSSIAPGCHNPDKKKGDLDLTSYSGALKGGRLRRGTGCRQSRFQQAHQGAHAHGGADHAAKTNLRWRRKKSRVQELDRRAGLLETSGLSKAIAAARPVVDLALRCPTWANRTARRDATGAAHGTGRSLLRVVTADHWTCGESWAPLIATLPGRNRFCSTTPRTSTCSASFLQRGAAVGPQVLTLRESCCRRAAAHGAKIRAVTLWM